MSVSPAPSRERRVSVIRTGTGKKAKTTLVLCACCNFFTRVLTSKTFHVVPGRKVVHRVKRSTRKQREKKKKKKDREKINCDRSDYEVRRCLSTINGHNSIQSYVALMRNAWRRKNAARIYLAEFRQSIWLYLCSWFWFIACSTQLNYGKYRISARMTHVKGDEAKSPAVIYYVSIAHGSRN